MDRKWWKESVIYQIYPRSFKDTTGNGIGDIAGIIEKLDYIKSLGVNVIWLCPVYESPNDDNGYDISDYRNISEEFGGNDAFDLLIKTMHEKGLNLVMDLVANHSSDEHEWFKQARLSKDNEYRDYYHWKDAKPDGSVPNNWTSFFNGSTWEYNEATDDYYLHLFTKKQPDLKWENPRVRQEIGDVIKFWCEKGVDGFRMDVISVISKNMAFPDATSTNLTETINDLYANGPEIHNYLQEMNQAVLSKYDIMTVGEGPGINLSNGLKYVDKKRNELNMIFHFDHMFIDNGPAGKYDIQSFDLVQFKSVFTKWDALLKNEGWGSIFLGNHDFSRMVNRFGNAKAYHNQSAKLLASILLTLRGTVYLYQGDEIGMTNVAFPTIEDYNDVETLNAYKEAKNNGEDMLAFMKKVHLQSRDNARTPMQWDASKNANFSTAKPWLKVNPNYQEINVESQEKNKNSILNFYRDMIQFRHDNLTLVYGDYEELDAASQQIFAYRRFDADAEFLIIHNMSDAKIAWDFNLDSKAFHLVKSNYNDTTSDVIFQPWQTKIFKV